MHDPAGPEILERFPDIPQTVDLPSHDCEHQLCSPIFPSLFGRSRLILSDRPPLHSKPSSVPSVRSSLGKPSPIPPVACPEPLALSIPAYIAYPLLHGILERSVDSACSLFRLDLYQELVQSG